MTLCCPRVYNGCIDGTHREDKTMESRLSVRLNEDYLERLDLLCGRLGINRTQLIKNLLSGDSALIDVIASKAKTLHQVTIDDVLRKGGKADE